MRMGKVPGILGVRFLGGAWRAQSVKHPTLDFGSGHDLRVNGIDPCVRLCTDSMEPAWDSLSLLSLYPTPAHTYFLSLSISQK